MPALYLKDSQQHLADLSEADLAAMQEAMEEESSTDRDYFIDLDTVYLLRAVGLSEPVAAALEKAVGDSDGVDVIWH